MTNCLVTIGIKRPYLTPIVSIKFFYEFGLAGTNWIIKILPQRWNWSVTVEHGSTGYVVFELICVRILRESS